MLKKIFFKIGYNKLNLQSIIYNKNHQLLIYCFVILDSENKLRMLKMSNKIG